jgi:hypothetical protein
MVAVAPAETATLSVRRYEAADREAWNDLVRRAKNGVFLFDRGYMEYHADRFRDHSLLVESAGKLTAVVPGNLAGDTFVSHGGLTFGGVVSDARMRAGTMLRVFGALLRHLQAAGVRTVVYKAIPHIYHRMPAEEDLYALFRCGATLVRRDIAAAIEKGLAAPYTKGRKWGVKKGAGSGVTLERSDDFEGFMAVEEANLADRHNVRPVHTAAELRLLAQRFPENIRLYVAREGNAIVAGTLVYASERVAHTQYIATTPRGRELCALDALLDWLIHQELAALPVFDFGISTEQAGRLLNEGLAENKESYGARGIVYDHYELKLPEALQRLEGS